MKVVLVFLVIVSLIGLALGVVGDVEGVHETSWNVGGQTIITAGDTPPRADVPVIRIERINDNAILQAVGLTMFMMGFVTVMLVGIAWEA